MNSLRIKISKLLILEMHEETTKKACKAFIDRSGSDDIRMFEKDINERMSHTFIATSYRDIYESIRSGECNNYYETIDATQHVKLFFDYDKKIKIETDPKKRLDQLKDNTHIHDIHNIINRIRVFFPSNEIYILKSIPDTEKKSYHIIVNGAYFKNMRILKTFIKENFVDEFKELHADHIMDMSVYGSKCLRIAMCTKYNQERPLLLLRTETFINEMREEVITDIPYDTFLKTCICKIDDTCVEFKYKSSKKKVQQVEGDVYTEKEVIKQYLDLLDSDRYVDRNKWLNIGYILYSIDKDYSDLWHYFSKKWDKYDENHCNVAWESFANNEQKYTVHNLMHLASIDSPNEFSALKVDIPNHDIKYMRPYDNVISKLIYRMYGSEFICSDPQENEWYFFNGTRWNKENKNYNLRKRTINDVFTKVEAYRRQLIKENAVDDIIKTYNSILRILGNGLKLNCLELEFYNSKFNTILDQNDNLLGFENGIYDLSTMEFRPGVCSDYVSMSTHYDFIEIPTTSPEYRKLDNLISQIFPNPEIKHFMMKALCSCLDGHTRDEKFYIWSGKNHSGGNGKSTITDLALKALGDYGCMSPVTLMTGKPGNAGNSNSALANIRNKRLVIMQEPGASDVIQAGTMKNLTGGDEVSTRDLFKTQMSFKVKAKFFLCCNIIPSISVIDGGVSRRLLITEFTSRFVDDPMPDITNGIHEYKIDRDLKSILPDFKNVFMNMMLNYYKIYKVEGLVPPEIVRTITKKYESDNNVIKQFSEEKLQKTTLRSNYVSKEQLRDEYNRDPILKQAFGKFSSFLIQLENTMCSEFKKDKNGKYRLEGWCIKSDDMYEDTEMIDE